MSFTTLHRNLAGMSGPDDVAMEASLRSAFASDGPPARLVTARAGDHLPIHQFLLAVFQQPSLAEFQASLDAPQYEPADRLLIKRGERILAHVQLLRREMRFGPVVLPVCELVHLATLPEFRSRGLASVLLEAAEKRMAADDVLLATIATTAPRFLERRDWAVCGRHSFSVASPRQMLAWLKSIDTSRPVFPPKSPRRLKIRLWRQVELGGLIRIWEHESANGFGRWLRNDAYWRWLVAKPAYDRIYIITEGKKQAQWDAENVSNGGYAVMRGGQIVELVSHPYSPVIANLLVARACADAIEHDHHAVAFHAAPDHFLHQCFVAAGGETHCAEMNQRAVFMAKVFQPAKLLRAIAPAIAERARLAHIEPSSELGIHVENEKFLLSLNRQNLAVTDGRVGRNYLTLGAQTLTQVLLGHRSVTDAISAGDAHASTQVAVKLTEKLFPLLPMWRPVWDDLPAKKSR